MIDQAARQAAVRQAAISHFCRQQEAGIINEAARQAAAVRQAAMRRFPQPSHLSRAACELSGVPACVGLKPQTSTFLLLASGAHYPLPAQSCMVSTLSHFSPLLTARPLCQHCLGSRLPPWRNHTHPGVPYVHLYSCRAACKLERACTLDPWSAFDMLGVEATGRLNPQISISTPPPQALSPSPTTPSLPSLVCLATPAARVTRCLLNVTCKPCACYAYWRRVRACGVV